MSGWKHGSHGVGDGLQFGLAMDGIPCFEVSELGS